MALSKQTFEEFLSARQELLDERELSLSADSDSPSRVSLLRRREYFSKKGWLPPILVAILVFIFVASAIFVGSTIIRIREANEKLVHQTPKVDTSQLWQDNKKLNKLTKDIQNAFNASRIVETLKYLAQGIHMAGTRDNAYVMRWIAEQYRSYGIPIQIYNYTVLLNYPDFERPNTVEIQDEYSGRWQLLSDGLARPVGNQEQKQQQADRRGMVWWNAYSGNGTVESRVVYANYGFKEDFSKLKERGIQLKGAIMLIRLGGLTRSEKVREAENVGAGAVMFFNDPLHYSSVDSNLNFPNDIFLPGSDAQRGSLLGTVGDPETPGLPSLPFVQRFESIEMAKEKGFIPKIPVMPIGYEDAMRIMHALNELPVQDPSWRGGLETTYRYTGSRAFKMSVRSINTHRTISNVIATIRGTEEPDKWVMVGNHADAWTYGAVDPLTGTATQIEMARVFSKMPPPRRSIVFCHWDAEEFGLIGSSEFVEEMANVLSARAVAYINVDHVAGNTSIDARGAPLLYRLLTDSASKVSQPNPSERTSGRESLLDSWLHYRPASGILDGDRSIPDISPPNIGSDYHRFISYLGVPAADLRMENPPAQSYPLYHTMYEIPYLIDLMDPNGKAMRAVGQLWAEATHRLANNLILPLNVMDSSRALHSMSKRTVAFLKKLEISNDLRTLSKGFQSLDNSIQRLSQRANSLEIIVADVTLGIRGLSPVKIEQLNSRLMQFERCFLDCLSTSPLHKHILYSPSNSTPSPSGVFTVISDLALQLFNEQDQEKKKELSKKLLLAVSRVHFSVEKAIHLLDIDLHGF